MKKINLCIIPVLSILTFIIIFALCYIYNSCAFLVGHDLMWTYNFNLEELPASRFPAFFLSYIYNAILPGLFNTNLTDFKSEIIGCTIVSLYYFTILFIISRGFFIIADKNQKNIFRFENILILPICFVLLTMAFNIHDRGFYFQGISEIQTYLDWPGGCLFYFLFFILLINIILSNKNITLKEKIFYSVIGLVLGLWNEMLNLATFFSVFVILALLALFNKEKLKNTSIYYLFGSFIVGFLMYYFVVSDFTFNNLGSLSNYDILNSLKENLHSSDLYFKTFFSIYIVDKIIYWMVIVTLTVILLLQLFIKSKLDNEEKSPPPTQNTILALFILFSIIAGFFIACSCSIVITNYRFGFERYIIERDSFQLLGVNVYIFIIISLFGIIYYNVSNKIRKVLACLIICVSLFLLYNFVPDYIEKVKNRINDKFIIYNIEKTIVIYSTLGEIAVLPNDAVYFLGLNDWPYLIGRYTDEYIAYIENKYWHKFYFSYQPYFNSTYKHKLKGIQFKDDENAAIELQKRMELFGKSNEEKTKFPIIKFSDMNLYDNIDLTIEDINNKEKILGQNDILLKAKAYINYRDKNYIEAINLYKQYIKNNPKDYDALINTAKMYEENGNNKEAKDIYKKLIEIDNENYIFNFNLMNIYYEEGNYKEALKINTKLLETQKSNFTLNQEHIIQPYINQALIYRAMKNMDKTKEYIDEAEDYSKKLNLNYVNEYILSNGLEQPSDLINNDMEIHLIRPVYE